MNPAIAVQLFTLRDACASDFAGALRRVAGLGFRFVEFGGFHGKKPAELAKMLGDCGLGALSGHFGYQELRDTPAQVAQDAVELGLRFVVCPYLDESLRKSAASYREVGRTLEKAARVLQGRGLKLCYHHHAFEFARFDGQTGLSWLLGACDPSLVLVQVDTYWAHEGGEDPAAFIRGFGRRCPLVHLKDRAADGSFAEVGSGTLSFDPILAAARESGAASLIVEQDSCPRDPFDCIAASLAFLRQKGLA